MIPDDDATLLAQMRERLTSSLIGDILDNLGYRQQFLPPRLRALDPDKPLAGRAMPVLESDYLTPEESPGASPLGEKPFGLMLEALDDLRPDEVYIASGSSPRYALWGGLMTLRALQLGAAGAVLNGYSRDTQEILSTPFPVFSYGSYGQDQGPRGKVIDYRVPIEIEGVRVDPGDLLFGDVDGVVVIPQAIEKETVARALQKGDAEDRVRNAILEGMSTVEAFRTFGVM
ncbi:RraA family protein [Halomonas sp. HP20-15]|uniref:RraA family protein n=1 Tax=Halomonas sp. HP20-15 TaxID=3085901 RepID=UPI0029826EDB|nr:RraA family protein [Halomonas sp. HP20-15]MDW5377702.1 RraA family protein [Halomonas sp. HP20-15]